MRSLWIQQVGAGVREHGVTYSKFINAQNLAKIELNRKILADLANTEPLSFRAIVEVCKSVKPIGPIANVVPYPVAPEN